MENQILSGFLSGIYCLRIPFLTAQIEQIKAAPSPDTKLTVNHPTAVVPNLGNPDECYDMMSDLKPIFDVPQIHINVVNRNTRRNPSQKNDSDLADYVIVSRNLSIPKNFKLIVGHELLPTRKRVENCARKEFQKSDAARKLAMYREGLLGTVLEDRLNLLEHDAAEGENARAENVDDGFVIIRPEDLR